MRISPSIKGLSEPKRSDVKVKSLSLPKAKVWDL